MARSNPDVILSQQQRSSPHDDDKDDALLIAVRRKGTNYFEVEVLHKINPLFASFDDNKDLQP